MNRSIFSGIKTWLALFGCSLVTMWALNNILPAILFPVAFGAGAIMVTHSTSHCILKYGADEA